MAKQTDKAGSPKPQNKSYSDRLGEPQLLVRNDVVPAYEELLSEWRNCERCPLYASRSNVVFVKGTLPADIFFIGDVPGPTEDDLGFPYAGRYGKILNAVLDELYKSRQGWNYAIANPVGCVPWSSETSTRPANSGEVSACNPRFLKIIELANPKGVVLLGQVAERFWADYGQSIQKSLGTKYMITCVAHPSKIMTNGGVTTSNMTYRTVLSALKGFLFQQLKVGK